MKKYIPSFILFIASSITGCAQKTFEEKVNGLLKETVPFIKTDELQSIQNEVVILDTRTPEEYEISHLNGAKFIDYDHFKAKDVKEIPKDAEVVVYCSIGYRSERIGEKLQKLGYSNVKNLYGGIFDWKNKEQEVVNMDGSPTDSVHTYNKTWSKWLLKGTKIYD